MTENVRWVLLAVAIGIFLSAPDPAIIGPETYGRWRFMGGLVNGIILGALFYKMRGDNV